MNYALHFSNRVENELTRLVEERFGRDGEDSLSPMITAADEKELYREAFKTIVLSDEGRTKAAGNVRIGEFILIIDSDTRVVCSLPNLCYLT